jgi:Ca-activated chloride channel homolog
VTIISCRRAALFGLACTFISAAWGADRAHNSDFRVDSKLVLIPVSVTDPYNHAVTGLPREAFHVFEGKVEQALVHFGAEDAPVSIGIVFDSSGSMRDKLAASRDAVARFLSLANPEDEFFLVDFNATARVTVPFTADPRQIQNQLLLTQPGGRTALLDAVTLAIDSMKNARNPRHALLIISDGGDNDSRYTELEIRRRVRESDLWIYSIGFDNHRGYMLPEEDHGPTVLANLAAASGGRHFIVRNPAELSEAASAIGLELRNQYVVGYRPVAPARNGGYHKVQVRLMAGRDLHVTWKPGYYDTESER